MSAPAPRSDPMPGFARALRAAKAKIGNFVEIKAASIEASAEVVPSELYRRCAGRSAGANIGAGTITCNYDGFSKVQE